MSKTNESIWNDIRRRGIGADIKKEDNVNNMGIDDFVDYLVANYRDKVYSMDKDHFCKEYEMDIVVNPIKDIVIYGSYVNDELSRIMVVLRNRGQIRLDDWIGKIIENSPDNFRWICMYSDRYELKLKKGDITNQTYVDLIEFFLNNITLFESVWGDIRRRGNGTDVKKEDDVNLLDIDELYDYIKSKYEKRLFYLDKDVYGPLNKKNIVADVLSNVSLFTIYDKKGNLEYILLSWSKVKIGMPFFDKLSERFNVQSPNVCRRRITEKDGTCTNQTYIDVIDFFLENMDNMLVNESVWNDIRKRGNGEQIRKEDEMTEADFDALNDCIFEFATRVVWDNWKYSRESFCKCVYDYTRYSTTGEKANVDNILKYVNSHWAELNTELDDAIEKEQNEKDDGMNESVWNDIRKRGVGDSVKQEEFTEEFIDKVKSDLIGFTMSVVYYIENYELTFDGFYKYLEEIENPDEVKKIIYYVKTHKDECDKLLEKDIKFENKLLDEKVNVYLLRFIDNIVYDEKYHNTLSDIKKFASEIFKGHKSSYDFHINKKLVFKDKYELFNDYIEDKWKDGSLKQKIDDLIKNENDKISKYGFVKEPGKTIADTVNDWWDSLDDSKRDELAWDEFGEDAEEAWMSEHHRDVDYDGEDFDADEWWDNAYGIRRVKIYCSEHSKTNESVWNDIRKRGNGDEVKKEDEMTPDDFLMLRETAKMFRNVLKRSANEPWSGTCDDFIKYINLRKKEHFWNDTPDEVYDKVIKFVKDNWDDCTGIQDFMDKYLSNINECEGVPGGATPANVGGMGAAYFPGPNGEPGSGDLPSPTGIVYHQVAPYTVFLKELKKKKKKKTKKFRKEDELCVHSENPPIYSHVDDFRDYVDRVYNQIDRKK